MGKVRPARTVDNSAVLVVPNVKIRVEAQHSISALSPHDLLLESFTLPFTATPISLPGCADVAVQAGTLVSIREVPGYISAVPPTVVSRKVFPTFLIAPVAVSRRKWRRYFNIL